MAHHYDFLADLDETIGQFGHQSNFEVVAEQIRGHKAQLLARGIDTYPALFKLFRDEHADQALLKHALGAMWYLTGKADRRRAVPALAACLNFTSDLEVRRLTTRTLTMMSEAYARKLLSLVYSKTEDEEVRLGILSSVRGITNPSDLSKLREIIFDESDSILVRSAIIEWVWPFTADDYLEPALKLLENPSPDIRFWTLFSLTNEARYSTLDPRLMAALDKIAAFDHTLPVYWDWHVDREAFEPLADQHYHPYRQPVEDEDDHPEYIPLWLLSPAPEYMQFTRHYRGHTPDGQPIIKEIPRVETHVEVDWLWQAIRTEWPDARFDVIPAPREVYLLDWLIEIDGQTLLGGLHRDQYAVVLKSPAEAAYVFIDWYRSIRPEKSLFVYGWADDGIELKAGETMQKFE